MLYPEMTAQIRAEHAHSVRRIRINADVSGFILDVDSNLPDYVFSLVDVYRRGKEQFSRLSASTSNPPASAASPTTSINELPEPPTHQNAPSTSNVFASLVFRSGKVRLYSSATAHFPRNRTVSFTGNDSLLAELGSEVLRLPEVSVWGEYRAAPSAYAYAGGTAPPSILIFKSTVHSSQNTLLPTIILPFMSEFNTQIERRMRTAPWLSQEVSSTSNGEEPMEAENQASGSNMQISLSLRIDQSKLELTCQPDVNVVAGVNWESGGFVVNISPRARRIAFTGAVEGLTVSLRHGFLSEDCLTLQARNLGFSTTFLKSVQQGQPVSTISLVVDTEFSGACRFSRLQDLLCFKAVWLDRIPVFTASTTAVPQTPSTPGLSKRLGVAPEAKTGLFTTALLIRLRRVKVDVDLGQSISAVAVDAQDVVVRTELTESVSEVSLGVSNLSVEAVGNVAGHADVPNFVFQTVRRTKAVVDDRKGRNTMLDLHMTSGPLNVVLQSEHQELLQYR
jgi:hypothetical protein